MEYFNKTGGLSLPVKRGLMPHKQLVVGWKPMITNPLQREKENESMAKKKRNEMRLILPTSKDIAKELAKLNKNRNLVPDPKRKLKVTVVNDRGVVSNLLPNIAIAASLFLFCSLLMKLRFSHPVLVIGVPLSVVIVLAVYLKDRLYTNVQEQEAEVWLDGIFSDVLEVLKQGFHFTRVWHSKGETKLSFRNAVPLGHGPRGLIVLETQCKCAKTVKLEVAAFYQDRDDEEGLKKRLLWPDEVVKQKIGAYITASLTALCGLNSYEVIKANLTTVKVWTANLFGGKDFFSELEVDTGTRVGDPDFENLSVVGGSNDIFEKQAKGDAVAVISKKLLKVAGDGLEALKAAQRVVGVLSSSDDVITVKGEGLPPGLNTLAVGSNVAVKGGK